MMKTDVREELAAVEQKIDEFSQRWNVHGPLVDDALSIMRGLHSAVSALNHLLTTKEGTN